MAVILAGACLILGLYPLIPKSDGPRTEGRTEQESLRHVAAKAGEKVSFEAEVKGVSRSPRTGVVYLNFGDAYPRQILSVKIPREVNEPVERSSARMFGRRARVTGRIEATNSGPVITVSEPGQLQVIRSLPGDVLNERAEGLAYQWRVRAAVDNLLEEKQYARLEALARRWRKEKTRMDDGQWLLPVFYAALAGEADDEAGIRARRVELEAWRKARPAALEPVIALASLEVGFAWRARGGGYASTVTEEGWRFFGRRLTVARRLLDGLGDRFGQCPHAAAVMGRIALGQGWAAADYAALYTAAISREPEYLPHYFHHAYHLLPRWRGAPGEWENYARAAAPGEFGEELRARIPWAQHRLFWNIFAESKIQWSDVRGGFQALLRRYPGSARNLSAYALFAGMADDRKTCLRLLEELGDRADMSLWVNWENVAFAKRWATDPTQPPPVIFRLVPRPEDFAEERDSPG